MEKLSKICNKCKDEKPILEFNTRKTCSKDGYFTICKICQNEKSKQYYIDNNEKLKEKHKEYYIENKEKISIQQNKYRLNNLDRLRENEKKRKKTDPIFKLTTLIRTTICQSLKMRNYTKKSRSYEILGCSYEEFKLHLESQFQDWMTWENRGLYKKNTFNYGWDIDHITPISGAKTEEDVIKLNHYTNLQPLCSKLNRDVKRHKI